MLRILHLARIGYALVSTTDQDLDIQIGRLKNACCEIIRSETGSGASRSGRTELETIMQFMHTGDELVVLRLDRLGRSTRDVLNLVHELDEKGASLRILEPEVTTAGDMGRMVITILGMVADMELKFIKDRQRAGIEAARAEGVYKGRKKNVDDDEIRRRLAAGASKARVARDLKVSRMTVYRALDINPSQTKLPEKPPTASIALHLIIENFNKRGSGRKPARERIEAMLERDYAMVETGNCEYIPKVGRETCRERGGQDEMIISDWSSDVCSSALRASKARVARDLKVSRMTVYRALYINPSQTKLPEKPPTASIALHLIIENFNKRGRGRKPAREWIEAMLERDYAMVKNVNCDYKLTVAYDPDPDGISLDEEIQSLLSEMLNIAESYN